MARLNGASAWVATISPFAMYGISYRISPMALTSILKTQSTQRPVLRAWLYARAVHASQKFALRPLETDLPWKGELQCGWTFRCCVLLFHSYNLLIYARPLGQIRPTTVNLNFKPQGISKEFKEWIAIAKDRPKWRQQTHSKPKPPDAWWLMDNLKVYDNLRVYGYNCIMQQGHSAQSDLFWRSHFFCYCIVQGCFFVFGEY